MRCSLPCLSTPRPVAALSDEYPQGHLDPRHRHGRAQLLFAAAGVMIVTTDAGSYVVPPQKALWLPAGVEHEVLCRSAVSLRTLYVEADAVAGLPVCPQVIEVSGLLRALILEAMTLDADYAVDGRDGRIMRLILDEIAEGPRVGLFLPMPSDERLLRLCRHVLTHLTAPGDLDAWAEIARMGRRTMTRLFRLQTGMSFVAWRQRARLVTASARLSEGCSVLQAACEVGYDSPSAFTALFQRELGTTPSVYIRQARRPAPGGTPEGGLHC
ncbi:AraC family transcriptional regulator [Lichenicoccus roseus]|uniref:AraC family transcriptional regulator n=1 Tax=Lichenicoccus roseus TaxID=2683649 RepID=A0A5R9J6T3_9PROT|nr:helix-turn-helix transcriptional regulator [Lichenicoccus roseus]TLU72563.1 AraC family transcriptional regulator [Lichenicoccus roseus]